MAHPMYIGSEARRSKEATLTTVYFDSKAPDDNGDGTIGNPYQQLTNARLIQGRNLIKRGSYWKWTGTVGLAIPTGTITAPVILDVYGDGPMPVIDGSEVTDYVLRIDEDATDVRIRYLEVTGPGGAVIPKTIISNVAPNNPDTFKLIPTRIVIEHCFIHDIAPFAAPIAENGTGIRLYGAENDVRYNTIYRCATDAAWFYGHRCFWYKNTITYTSMDGQDAGDGIQAGSDCSYSVVDGNYIDHTNVDGKQSIFFETASGSGDPSTGVLILNNTCLGVPSTVAAHVPIVAGGDYATVRGNYVTGGTVGINSAGAGSKIIGNIAICPVGRGMDVNGSNSVVTNNVCRQTGTQTGQTLSVGIRNSTAAITGIKFENNLLIGFGTGIATVTGPGGAERNNAFLNCLVKFRINGVNTATSNEVSVSNTSFRSDYTLPASSGLIAAGHKIGPGYFKYYNPPSVGPYEYVRQREAR